MHVENSPDFKTVWELAHNWVSADSTKTDPTAVSTELRVAIHRLMHAMANGKITVRWKGLRIFMDESYISSILDIYHIYKFYRCLRKNKFDKNYLNNLYAKRSEVIDWCINVERLDPPPCWTINNPQSLHLIDIDEESDGWYEALTERRRKKVACLELAKKLWEENPDQSYEEIRKHPLMKQYGNPSVFTDDAFQRWAKDYASDFARKSGRRKKSKT